MNETLSERKDGIMNMGNGKIKFIKQIKDQGFI
jgi:hypothetical protein